MVKRILCVLIGTIAFSLAAFAQTESQHLEFEGFDAVVIEDEFDVTFRESRNYMVDYTVDAALENNRLVEIYARGNTLYISLNRKGMSSDLKKQYRGRNAGKAVLKAVIYAPSISSLTVRGKAVFDAAGTEFIGKSMALTVSDNAKVSGITINTEELTVDLSKAAEAVVKADVEDIIVRNSGTAILTLNYFASKADITAGGSSKTSASGDVKSVSVHAKGNPDISLSGKGDLLKVEGSGTTDFDGVNYTVREAITDMSGSSKAYVSASEKLSLNLRGGHVVFSGEPVINILSIKSASVTRLSDEKVRR